MVNDVVLHVVCDDEQDAVDAVDVGHVDHADHEEGLVNHADDRKG